MKQRSFKSLSTGWKILVITILLIVTTLIRVVAQVAYGVNVYVGTIWFIFGVIYVVIVWVLNRSKLPDKDNVDAQESKSLLTSDKQTLRDQKVLNQVFYITLLIPSAMLLLIYLGEMTIGWLGIFEIFLLILLGFATTKGHKNAVIILMVLFLVDRIMLFANWNNQISTSPAALIGTILVSILVWSVFYRAYLVLNTRGKMVDEALSKTTLSLEDKPRTTNLLSIRWILGPILGLSILGGLFYWFQIRPTRIRHDCSWIKVVTPPVPAFPMMTEDELRDNGMLQSCTTTPTGIFNFNLCDRFNERLNKEIIKEYSQPREPIPEKISWRESSNSEYAFCLRDKGL